MKRILILCLPLMCAAAPQPALDGIIDLARSVPGEFAADAMIRMAGLQSFGKERKVALLEEAFWRATEAEEAYPRQSALASTTEPSRFLNRAYAQGLDRMSLQLRAVEAVLPLDARKAREMFREMPPINFPRVACSDFLVYGAGGFYETLGRIAEEAFSPEERAREEVSKFLAGYIAPIASSLQVAPAARMLARANLKNAEFQALVTEFAGVLSRISGDDRSFTFSASRSGAAILALADACRRRQMPPTVLVEAYRAYLVQNLSGSRCGDDRLFEQPAPAGDPVVFFNQEVRDASVQAIRDDEVTPSQAEGDVRDLRWCQDAECQAIDRQYRALLLKPDGSLYQASERDAEWQAKLRDFLGSLAEWHESSGISAGRQFREKNGIFSNLLSFVPGGPIEAMVIRAELDFLSESRFEASTRVEWFFPVNQLITRLGSRPQVQVLDELKRANDPVIALYQALETIAPRPGEDTTPLL
ncbi:MAG TPA: hypothetical protein VJ732_14700 [Bryobacteraceae bacterium]|nr:hypothetical protein [Bryobacteraceae bacterium]